MLLNKEVVLKMMEERNMSIEELARLYRGNPNEFYNMCNYKIGFNRAYQLAEIFDCTVDDIVTNGNEKWPTYPGKNKKQKKKNKK